MTDVGTFSGPNWRYEDGVFSFFNFSGFVFGRRWALPVNDRGDVHLETPRPIRRDVDAVIADDIRKGKGGMIDYVSMGAYETLRLALEGVITIELLRSSSGRMGESLIIPNVPFEHGPRKVVVSRSTRYTAMTFDRSGRMV